MPGRRCTVCDHPERKAIEVAMAVSSVRNIAERFGLKPGAVHSHQKQHLRPAAARLAVRREEMGAQALLDRLLSIADSLEGAFEDALKNGDHVAVARLSKELRETLVRYGQATRGLWCTAPQTVIDNRRQTVVAALDSLTLDQLRSGIRRLESVAVIDGDV